MDKTIENGQNRVSIKSIALWDKNPRDLKEEDFERLKAQLVDFGQYKPLLVTKSGTIVGGNMRYRAMKFLNENVFVRTLPDGTQRTYDLRGQFNTVWVTELDFEYEPVAPGQPATVYPVVDGQVFKHRAFSSAEHVMTEYALSDNDNVGRYNNEALAMLVTEFQPFMDMDMFKIEVAAPIPLQTLMNDFGPDGTDPTIEDLPEPKEEKEKKHKLSFTFDHEEDLEQVKAQLDDLKRDLKTDNDSDVLVLLLKNYFDPQGIDGKEVPGVTQGVGEN